MRRIESTLNKKQIFLSRVCTGAAVFLFGILSLLAALNLFSAPFIKLILPLFFCVAALLLAALSLIQQNTLLLWFFPFAALLGLTLFLRAYGVAGFHKLYPLLIAAPALGSVLCGIYCGIWKDHLKVILIFAPSSLIFCLNAALKVKIGVTIAAFLIFLGAAAIAHTLLTRKKIKEKTNGDTGNAGDTNERN